MRVSLIYYPDDPAQEALEIIKATDNLGFYACYLVDSSLRKDLWLLLGAAADKTKRVRLGPNAVRLLFKDPTLIAQSLATLDELTGGRVDAVIGLGGSNFFSMYHIPPEQLSRPWARVREAVEVIRIFLDQGKVDFQGEFYKYTGLTSSARPVQEHLPVKVATIGGPRAMEVAAEVADGMHVATVASREYCEYALEHVRIGAARAGRNWKDLDLGASVIWVCGQDGRAAREVARIQTSWYISIMPRKLIELHGVSYETLQPIRDAWARGDIGEGIKLTTPDLADKLAIAGTPEECAEKVKAKIQPTGMNHLLLSMTDPPHVKLLSGMAVEGVPNIKEQLRLIHDRVLPELN